jgi:hypothetical protein
LNSGYEIGNAPFSNTIAPVSPPKSLAAFDRTLQDLCLSSGFFHQLKFTEQYRPVDRANVPASVPAAIVTPASSSLFKFGKAIS